MMEINGEVQRLMNIFTVEEDLDDELKDFLVQGAIPMLAHPLIRTLYNPQQNAMFNRVYHHKQEGLTKALQDKEWSTYVFMHERPYRVDAFVEIMDYLAGKEYWKLLHDIYIDTENFWQNRDTWVRLLSSNRFGRDYMTADDEDLTYLRNLRAPIPVYRGFSHSGASAGVSWTLNEGTAQWFAKRLLKEGRRAMVAVGFIMDTTKIIGYTNQRMEKEIIILPENVENKLIGAVT